MVKLGNVGKGVAGLLTLGVVIGAGFSVGTFLTKAAIGYAQQLTGIQPPLASYWSDWDAGLQGGTYAGPESYIPYLTYAGSIDPSVGSYNLLNELPFEGGYLPIPGFDYTFDF